MNSKRQLFLGVLNFTFFVMISAFSFGQNPTFDRLELLYEQGHYAKVYKQSGKLLNKPEYDEFKAPKLYRALSIFQLSENRQWLKSRGTALNEAIALYEELQKTADGQLLIENHLVEITELKQDIINRIGDLEADNKQKEAAVFKDLIANLFSGVPSIKEEAPIVSKPVEVVKEFTFDAKNRDEIVQYAKKQIGVPYKSAGTTPAGFDCSGFTTYVLDAYKIKLPRRAVDQYTSATKLKANKVKKGDLVFFDSGNGINHVGIIISEEGQPPVMIHASSSKGIVITDISSSDYWSKRLKGFGTYLD